MREHAAGLLKHSGPRHKGVFGQDITALGYFFHMTTHFNGAAISKQGVCKGGNFCAIFELRHTIFEIFAKM